MTPKITLRKSLSDPNLLGNILLGKSWDAWRALLIASMGEALTPKERAIFKSLTLRDHEPMRMVNEAAFVIGRRGGKSRAISVLAAWIAGLNSHPAIVSGERGVVMVVAPDQRQADVVFGHVVDHFEQSPLLSQMIEGQSARQLRLNNRIDIEVRAADFRRVRGVTTVAVIGDETCFWMTAETSSNPDSEILNALRPSLASTQGPLILISSPYSRRGEMWSLFREHFKADGDPSVLVAQASTRTMNPNISQVIIDRAYAKDPASAAAEYGAQWRSDLEAFVSREALDACISIGVHERPPLNTISYSAFCDASGGSGRDEFSLCVAHHDYATSMVIIDALRSRTPPFSPEMVIEEYATFLKLYRVSSVLGDRFGGEFPREQFSKFGISYNPAVPAKSQLYTDLLPMINSARIDLLDNIKANGQLLALERRTTRGSKPIIDHPPNSHDDLANVIAGCASTSLTAAGSYDRSYKGFQQDSDASDPARARGERQSRLPQWAREAGMNDANALGQVSQNNAGAERASYIAHVARFGYGPKY